MLWGSRDRQKPPRLEAHPRRDEKDTWACDNCGLHMANSLDIKEHLGLYRRALVAAGARQIPEGVSCEKRHIYFNCSEHGREEP